VETNSRPDSQKSSLKQKIFYPPVNLTLVKVLVDFIKQETGRFGITKCVIGLSGGIDSSVAAYLAKKALGSKNLLGVLLPYKASSPASVKDALTVAKALKIKTRIINITGAVDALCESIGIDSSRSKPDRNKIFSDRVRKGNIIARMRMICLYDLSNEFNGLVLGTGNKTEILLGYTTLYGDSASAINPIGDLYKTQIWQLAELLKIQKQIIKKKPSADLWRGQSDESELGFTYKQADELLYYMIDQRYSDKELAALGFTPGLIKRVKSLIRKNQFKRVMPIIAKVSNRTINIDFRYNRDWGS
jgi:NAD+ synthase